MSTPPLPLRGVMIFCCDPEITCRWYVEHVMRLSTELISQDSGFWFVDVGGQEVGFHPEDPERNPLGASTVPYFATPSLLAHRAALIARGASHHRGPLRIDDARMIAQLVDPFGGVFGLDGPP